MSAHTINLLDTLTNLILLLACILPAFYLFFNLSISTYDHTAETLHRMFKVKHNGHLKIITVRHPKTGKWLMSFTMGNKPVHIDITPKPVQAPVAMFSNPYRFAMGMLVIWLLAACESPTNPTNDGDKISTQYVQDGYSLNKSCWWPTATGDSLKVEGRKYTISNRSRYRIAYLDRAVIDSLLKGDVWVNDWAFYSDTKREDSIFVFNRCDMPNLGGD